MGEPPVEWSGGGMDDDDEWDEALAQINLNLQEKDEPPAPVPGHTYTFKNVTIQFPYPAYKSQVQMMRKIIEGVTTGENCLLESPTGTGKTAALLCSLLGWQKDCYERNDCCESIIQSSAEKLGGCKCGLIKDKDKTKVLLMKKKKGEIFLLATTECGSDDNDDKLVTPSKKMKEDVANSPGQMANSSTTDPLMKTPTKPGPTLSSCQVTPVASALQPATARKHEETPSPSKRKRSYVQEERHIDRACSYCVRKHVFDRTRPPRIYYCTRTHSQIAQVVKQLKATAYSDRKMTILASREPNCIDEKTLKFLNPNTGSQNSQEAREPKITLDDQCRTLTKNYFKRKAILERMDEMDSDKQVQEKDLPPVCEYFLPRPEIARHFSAFQRKGAWDLEDIKLEGESICKCPFYGCHSLQENSDIIFGSYNYLLQPSIRDATKVDYINSVLVFDEAHNIEDICRNVFSFELEVDKFDHYTRRTVDDMLVRTNDKECHVSFSTLKGLHNLSVTFKNWSDSIKGWGMREADRRESRNRHLDISRPYESEELQKVLTEMNMTEEGVSNCLNLLGEGDDEDSDTNGVVEEEDYYFDHHGHRKPFKVPSTVIRFLKNIKQTLQYLGGVETEGIGGIKDFKGYLTGVANPSRKGKPKDPGGSRRSFINQPQTNNTEGPEFFFKFQIICLNPAIGFRRLQQTAYSIIVASGTLTPLNSFASELATKFSVTLQADHVIPISNVWAGVISFGPSKQILRLTKGMQDDENIQDDIGRIICEICLTVPNGILVFFPSYTLMRKLENRWRCFPRGNSVYKTISKRKQIYTEESKDKQAFALNMQSYKENVKGGPNSDGCILFAVFRGKISEGIDFADEQARAVVTIGIPYSNLFASEIVSKKKYNDMRNATPQPGETFLSGSEWYTTQAFRAMNQGFGRCVRHCYDWGALIMIDSRMGETRNSQYISGWVKKCLRLYDDFSVVKSELTKFIENMKRQDKIVRKPIRIEYEEEISGVDLDCTEEIIPFPNDEFMDSQDDQMLTQVASIHDDFHNMTTQRVPLTSTPLPHREVTNVAESSPEYSFSEEMNEVHLGSFPTTPPPPPAAEEEARNASPNSSDNSVSIFERTPDSNDGNDSDRELIDIADRLQSSTAGETTGSDRNKSDVFDVSMPSAQESNSEHGMSQSSNVSYHSDWDTSVN